MGGYVLRRLVTGTYFSVLSDGCKSRKLVIYRNRTDAVQMMYSMYRMYPWLKNKGIEVEYIDNTMFVLCALNMLSYVSLGYDEEIEIKLSNLSVEDFRWNLEEIIRI